MPILNWFLDSLYKKKGIGGSARLLTRRERRKILRKRNKGFVVNSTYKLTRKKSFQNVIVASPTGQGKSVSYVVPNIMTLRDSMVITDPSGELLRICKNYLQKSGIEVKVLDFKDPYNSLGYNPIFRIQTKSDCRKIANIIIDSAYPKQTGDAFWYSSAKDLLDTLLMLLINLDESKQNLKELQRMVFRFSAEIETIDELMAQYADDDTFLEYKAIIKIPENTLGGIVTTLKTALSPMNLENLSQITKEETCFFETLRKERTALFIVAPTEDVKHYQFVLGILFTQLFDFVIQMPENDKKSLPIFFLLDEFANIGKIEGFEKIISVTRKFRVGISIILQDLHSQLAELYGVNGAKSIINGGVLTKIFYPGLPHETCKEISDTIGTTSIVENDYSRKRVERSRLLLMPDEIRTLRAGRLIFLHGSFNPAILRTRPWFKISSMVRKSKK